MKWYRNAAEQGDAVAQRCLGLYHQSGQGMTRNIVEATKWFRKAAAQGDADAQYHLGESCDIGFEFF